MFFIKKGLKINLVFRLAYCSQRTWNKWNQSGSTDDIADNNSFSTATDLGEYSTDYTYDFNGNILFLNRTGHYDYSGTSLNVMDELVYSYERDPFVSGLDRNRNRLLHVEDTETNSPYSTDIQIYTNFIYQSQTNQNYYYDEIGNLVKDKAENIDEIKWTLTGKVSEIIYNNANPTIAFKYDATGNRILKIVKHSSNQSDWEYTYYARDAQGNPMATYNISFANLGGNTYQCITKLAERHIYGSARLGLNQKETENIHKFSASINGTTGMFDFITNVAVELGPNSANQAKMFGGGSSPIALYHDTAQSYSVELYTEHPTKISSTAMAGFSISQGSGTWLTTDTFLTNAEQKITIEALDTLYLFSNFEDMFGYMEYSSAKTTKLSGPSISIGAPLLPIFAKNYYENERGNKVYELSSHLGNVHSVVADRKMPIQAGSSGNIDYYTADVVSNSDYYPFGSVMPGRNFNSSEYRYGWNKGSEKDDEITGVTGSHITTFFREYDTRLGRTWSLDPKGSQMPWQSSYSSMDNNPIWFNDPLGDEVEGVSKRDARQAKRTMKQTFKGSENKEIRKLFKTDGKKLEHISQANFDNATANSSEDTKALAKGYFDAINAPETHTVEILGRGGNLKSNLSKINGFTTGKDVDDQTGGGFNYQTAAGSHTVVIKNSKIGIGDYKDYLDTPSPNRRSSKGELLAHELLGHGLTRFNIGGNQFLNAIQLTNLYNSVKGNLFYRDGTFHGGGNGIPLPFEEATKIPPYLR